jgi:hypothetical protein
MSGKDRKPYLTAMTLDQDLLDKCQDNLSCQLEAIVDIETPDGFIYASDRNKYVGGTFYEALLNFPVISRTIGEWLTPEIEFSSLTLELNNSTGRFNHYLPAGADFTGWIGKTVEVKIGLREAAGTYFRVFKGKITDVGGFSRSVKSITIIARDQYDSLSVNFPTASFSQSTYPNIEADKVGAIIPVIYGDWTSNVNPQAASITTVPINGNDPLVNKNLEKEVTITNGTPSSFTCPYHGLQVDDPIIFATSGALPSPLIAGDVYYVTNIIDAHNFTVSDTLGGSSIDTTGSQFGVHTFKCDEATAVLRNVGLVISANVNTYLDTNNVFLFKNSKYYPVDPADVVNVNANKNYFEIKQNGATLVDSAIPYTYDPGDTLLVKMRGKDLGAYDDNIIEQARDILTTYASLSSGEFHSNWDTYRDKSAPTESAISTFKSRIWIQEPQPCIQYALSLLEQVRLEAFVDRDLTLKINSLHFDDFVASPDHTITNWDVAQDTFVPKLDEKTNFNRLRGVFNFLPDKADNFQQTPIFKNDAAITQAGKKISKQIVFPNLYDSTVVSNQVKEILKLSSSYFEVIETTVTWRSLLKDIGDFVKINVQIGATQFTNVPALIRDIGYDPEGLKLPVKLWSFQMVPFSGWAPGYTGIVGGTTATITQE